jgi:hypothetical protein
VVGLTDQVPLVYRFRNASCSGVKVTEVLDSKREKLWRYFMGKYIYISLRTDRDLTIQTAFPTDPHSQEGSEFLV